MNDYLFQRPAKVKLGKAILKHVITVKYLLWHVLVPVERDLRDPEKRLPTIPTEELGKEVMLIAKEMYEESQKRFYSIQTKAQQMLGYLSFITPLITALLVFVWKTFRSTISTIMFWLLVGAFFVTIILLVLVLLSILRCLSVTSLMIPFIDIVYDTKQHKYHDYSSAREAHVFLECALYNQVRNDQIADFLKAAQVFLGLALGFLILTSMVVATVVIINSFKPSKTISL